MNRFANLQVTECDNDSNKTEEDVSVVLERHSQFSQRDATHATSSFSINNNNNNSLNSNKQYKNIKEEEEETSSESVSFHILSSNSRVTNVDRKDLNPITQRSELQLNSSISANTIKVSEIKEYKEVELKQKEEIKSEIFSTVIEEINTKTTLTTARTTSKIGEEEGDKESKNNLYHSKKSHSIDAANSMKATAPFSKNILSPSIASLSEYSNNNNNNNNNNNTTLEVPIPQTSKLNVKLRKSSVRRGQTSDGRQAWLLISPQHNSSRRQAKLNNNNKSNKQEEEVTNSSLNSSFCVWEEKVVDPPPNHLPRRIQNIISFSRPTQLLISPPTPPKVRSNIKNISPQRFVIPEKMQEEEEEEEEGKSNHYSSIKNREEIKSNYQDSINKRKKKVKRNSKNKKDEDVVWIMLHRWIQERQGNFDSRVINSENDISLILQQRRHNMKIAAKTLLHVIQPIYVKELKYSSSSRLILLPCNWQMKYDDTVNTTIDPLSLETSLCSSINSLHHHNNSNSNNDDNSVLFQIQSEISSKRSIQLDGNYNFNNSVNISKKAEDISIEEKDYIRAFFNFQPLPLNDVNDVKEYMSFLYNFESFDNNNNNNNNILQRRESVQSKNIQQKQQEWESAGKYGLWCTVEPFIDELNLTNINLSKSKYSNIYRNNFKMRKDIEAPRWCMQICGGAVSQENISSISSLENISDKKSSNNSNMNVMKASHFDILFFPQPPDDPLNVFSSHHTENMTTLTISPIYSIPLTPQILNTSEVSYYKQIIMQQESNILIQHQQEENFVFKIKKKNNNNNNNNELFILYTNVSVNATKKYALDVSVHLLPCQYVDENNNNNIYSAKLVEIPLFNTEVFSNSTRCVHGATLTFTNKSSFLKAYQSLLWASEINTIDIHPTLNIPHHFNNNNNNNTLNIMILRCFASPSLKIEGGEYNSYHQKCVKQIASVLMQERHFNNNGPYKLEDFILESFHSGSKKQSLLSSATTFPLSTLSLSAIVSFDSYGAIYRSLHLPTSQIFDVRVLPRHETSLLWAINEEEELLNNNNNNNNNIPRRVMEAALVLEYISRMPFHNPIIAVLCDTTKYYIIQSPIFSALVENKNNSTLLNSLSQKQQQEKQQENFKGVIPLHIFINNVLKSPNISINIRWEISRIIIAQILLAIISIHGKGALLGPYSIKQILLQWNPLIISNILSNDNDNEKRNYKFTTKDFHIIIPSFGVHSNAWKYERQQSGVLKYLSPRYIFNTSYNTAASSSNSSNIPGWTIGDDYWTFLCLLFELFAIDSSSLVMTQKEEKQQNNISSASKLSCNRKDIWKLWKNVFTGEFSKSSLSSSYYSLNHKKSGISLSLHHYMQSRIENSIRPNLDAWKILTIKRESVSHISRSLNNNNNDENSKNHNLGAISLTDAYVASMLSHTIPTIEKQNNNYYYYNNEKREEKYSKLDETKDIFSIDVSMQTLEHLFHILIDISLKFTLTYTNKNLQEMTSSILAHPFFIGIDFDLLFDGKYPVPHAIFICKKLRDKKIFNENITGINSNNNITENRRNSSPGIKLNQQQQQQIEKPRLLSFTFPGEQQSCIPLLLLPIESEEIEISEIQNKNIGSAQTQSRSIYASNELEELKRVRDHVRQSITGNSFTNISRATSLNTQELREEQVKQKQKQVNRFGIPSEPLKDKSIPVQLNKKNINVRNENNNIYTPSWKQLQENSKLSNINNSKNNNNVIINRVEEEHLNYKKLKSSRHNSEYSSTISKNQFELMDPLLTNNLEREKRDFLFNNDGKSEWPENFLQVVHLKRKGTPVSQCFPSHFSTEEKLFYSADEEFEEPNPDDYKEEKEIVLLNSDNENDLEYQEEEIEEKMHEETASYHSIGTQSTKKSLNIKSYNTDKRINMEANSLTYLENTINNKKKYKELKSNDFTLINSEGTVEEALEESPIPIPKINKALFHPYNSRVSYSSSTFWSSPKTSSAPSPNKSRKQQQEQQRQRWADNIEWEIVVNESENEENENKDKRFENYYSQNIV